MNNFLHTSPSDAKKTHLRSVLVVLLTACISVVAIFFLYQTYMKDDAQYSGGGDNSFIYFERLLAEQSFAELYPEIYTFIDEQIQRGELEAVQGALNILVNALAYQYSLNPLMTREVENAYLYLFDNLLLTQSLTTETRAVVVAQMNRLFAETGFAVAPLRSAMNQFDQGSYLPPAAAEASDAQVVYGSLYNINEGAYNEYPSQHFQVLNLWNVQTSIVNDPPPDELVPEFMQYIKQAHQAVWSSTHPPLSIPAIQREAAISRLLNSYTLLFSQYESELEIDKDEINDLYREHIARVESLFGQEQDENIKNVLYPTFIYQAVFLYEQEEIEAALAALDFVYDLDSDPADLGGFKAWVRDISAGRDLSNVHISNMFDNLTQHSQQWAEFYEAQQ